MVRKRAVKGDKERKSSVYILFSIELRNLTPDWYIQFLSNYSCFLRRASILSMVLGVTDFVSHEYGMKDGFIDFTGKKSINNSHNYRKKK